MSKIIQAVNVMVSNAGNITEASEGYDGRELFFKYDKFVWSIMMVSGTYYLHYYPGVYNVGDVSVLPDQEWARVRKVSYNTADYPTKEAVDSFKELYLVVQEKISGIDEVLDKIIDTDLPF